MVSVNATVSKKENNPFGNHVYRLSLGDSEYEGSKEEIDHHLAGIPTSRISFENVSGRNRGDFRDYARGAV
ncbi:MAG: hypothetical protein HZB67_01170 [Candidatus Aenigmarchaeota archaeon]|nr:hypothetical protein [Candidatus Aenigmarchaeota archaeon]